ncbi:hydroxymethylbilane synthase [Acidithiobacillus thiooxidans]|uniref:Porphobilinogen deaminase n=2 Tax=Acidithiobacillus thiooxidans TaxID=930 RepID=A0A1C2IGQ0_ACITH|nr:hydroxymethylbilane synthase [Acidithiobacillus thiooxidans]MBU2842343.1 hydroxymethylbilane synthase [Acidithiobacillus thiooxidans]OCX75168.1 hydroxymethylbilane synthase [Acidithiobacillus thiooxidans]OCX77723.1 hydroxymethylbilane synthase [Acidithiobacillus thiooxidans]QFX97751.1 hydroxymethylbilane synthase [Acidithiobacillus thiooxidans ATCC 19377]
MMPLIRIGTRASPLAVWQAEHVRDALHAAYPDVQVEIIRMSTSGDVLLDAPLHSLGGKGLFVKEIEEALLARQVDIAVHSMKDVPALQPEGLEIAAIMAREDVRDAFVSNTVHHPEELAPDARVGSSSLRRRAQLLQKYPQVQVDDLRGNVATRLRKLDEGQYSAIILAVAGLKRLQLHERITYAIPVEQSLPAVGQGAVGIEIRTDDIATRELLQPLMDQPTWQCVLAERSMNRILGGDCRLPVAALAQWQEQKLLLRGLVASPDGSRLLRAEANGTDPVALGREVADQLLAQGAAAIIKEIQT